MFGIRLGRILGVPIALIGLSVFLASRFGPSSVGAGRGEPTATGFTMVSQQFLKQDDGTRLLKGIWTRYQRSDGAFRQDNARVMPGGELVVHSSSISVPGEGYVRAVRGRGVIDERPGEAATAPFTTLESIDDMKNNPRFGYRLLGTETILGFETHIVEQTKPDGHQSKSNFAPELLGFPIRLEIDDMLVEPLSIVLGEPDHRVFDLEQVLLMLEVN